MRYRLKTLVLVAPLVVTAVAVAWLLYSARPVRNVDWIDRRQLELARLREAVLIYRHDVSAADLPEPDPACPAAVNELKRFFLRCDPRARCLSPPQEPFGIDRWALDAAEILPLLLTTEPMPGVYDGAEPLPIVRRDLFEPRAGQLVDRDSDGLYELASWGGEHVYAYRTLPPGQRPGFEIVLEPLRQPAAP